MNIKEAKEEVRRSVEIYLDKDEQGEYVIPYRNQRPVFMEGAPGIGKTAVVEQVASELDVALVACSMSHYTIRSAVGRSYIREKKYAGKSFPIPEYTVGEIVASVYQVMDQSGKREGILFLDEINCVSEALTSAMLLLLQYKRFGGHQVPKGWVIVTAGNPVQYNKSAREFHVAALDRLNYIKVEPDFEVWKQYAYRSGIHAAIIAFLERNRACFFSICPAAEGSHYVTARGWEALSRAIRGYERKGFQIDRNLVIQYVTEPETARNFVCCYNLLEKCKSDYPAEKILEGQITEELTEQAKRAEDDERMFLMEIMLEQINRLMKLSVERENVLRRVAEILRSAKKEILSQDLTIPVILESECVRLQTSLKHRQIAHSIGEAEREAYRSTIRTLQQLVQSVPRDVTGKEQFAVIRRKFNSQVKEHESRIASCTHGLESILAFIEKAWGVKQEMHFFLTELAANETAVLYAKRWGCEPYCKYKNGLPGCGRRAEGEKEVWKLKL